MGTSNYSSSPQAKRLSAREKAVLGLAARGLANKQMAGALRISEHTVNSYWRRVFAKLGTHSRAAAVAMFSGEGLVT